MICRLILLTLFFGCFVAGCSNPKSPAPESDDAAQNQDEATEYVADVTNGKKVFDQTCKICHGSDGKLGLNGAKDLTMSMFTTEEIIHIVKTGKNTMTPFEGILTGPEILDVATYVKSLKK